MAVTIKQISAASGVSRGTVDRVLNNRGKVKPETEVLVRKIAEELGYRPNIAGKALAARKKQYKIGILLISEGNAFFDDVIRGVKQAEKEISDYGITIVLRRMKGYSVETQIEIMKELEGQVQLLILNAINDELIAVKMNEFQSAGVPVITINTECEGGNSLCHVGGNYLKSGEAACGMMGLLTNGRGRIVIATGSVKVLGHNQRIAGFLNIRKHKYKELEIIDMIETEDDEIQAFIETQKILRKYRDIDGIYIAAAGANGVCRAVMEQKNMHNISIVAVDDTPIIRELLQTGVIKATICQQPYSQGYRAVMLAYQYLIYGTEPRDYITDNVIKIQENL